jgi:hypothetical protein
LTHFIPLSIDLSIQDFDKESVTNTSEKEKPRVNKSISRSLWSNISKYFITSRSHISSVSSTQVTCIPLSYFSCSRSPFKEVCIVVGCFSLQMAMTALLWNRYVEQYQLLLETPATSAIHAVRLILYFGSFDERMTIIQKNL